MPKNLNRYLVLRDRLLGAIDVLFREPGNYIVILILVYSTIDIFSWLHLDDKSDELNYNNAQTFKKWVEEFMLVDHHGLPCTSDDLWAARCGLLHTGTAESRHFLNNPEVKLIRYSTGYESNLGKHTVLFDHGKLDISEEAIPLWERTIDVKLDDLFEALKLGAKKFTKHFMSDPKEMKKVLSRAERYFKTIDTAWAPVEPVSENNNDQS